mmetsp:Transcript_2953/g.4540  ORF Transcript_2953/g.4540 Transcript_2953/m.4540 type:complete len:99 (+) Transcript_2953:667-963(+)
MYPATESRGLDLLKRMLMFDPNKRISAEEALADEYFDEIRLDEQEEFDSCDIDLSFIDKYQEGELSKEELRVMIRDNIAELSKNTDGDVQRFIDEYYE